MKLIGSKTEREIREQLIVSNKSLFEDKDRLKLLNILRQSVSVLETAYILNWIPEQEEDFYTILINNSLIANIELNRHDKEALPKINLISLAQYKLGLSKINQIKLTVAMELAKEYLKKSE